VANEPEVAANEPEVANEPDVTNEPDVANEPEAAYEPEAANESEAENETGPFEAIVETLAKSENPKADKLTAEPDIFYFFN
jgi:hypothetical protein